LLLLLQLAVATNFVLLVQDNNSDFFIEEKIIASDCILVDKDFIEKTQQKLDFGGAS
jgi:hypothetical protein